MEQEVKGKIRLVRAMLAKCGYEGVVLRSQTNLAWLTGGRFFVNMASINGLGDIWIGPDKVELIINNIEAQRLWEEEEVEAVCDRLEVYPWYAEEERTRLIAKRVKGLRTADEQELAVKFMELRLKLTLGEQARYLELGRMAGEAVETVAREFLPGESEYQIAARISRASLERGMEPVVCLVGADERAVAYRHPLPTERKVKNYALLVLSARRWGLVASVTRAVHFGKVSAELAARQRAVNEVDATFFAASRPGTSLGDVFRKGQEAYASMGFPDEWEYHHQGGVTGYQSREIKAMAETTLMIESGYALAWNPTIQGTKAEDTILIDPDGIRIITATGNYPTEPVEVGGKIFHRPIILER